MAISNFIPALWSETLYSELKNNYVGAGIKLEIAIVIISFLFYYFQESMERKMASRLSLI